MSKNGLNQDMLMDLQECLKIKFELNISSQSTNSKELRNLEGMTS